MGEYMGLGMYADIIFVGDELFLPIVFLNCSLIWLQKSY